MTADGAVLRLRHSVVSRLFTFAGRLVQNGSSANPARAGELRRWAARMCVGSEDIIRDDMVTKQRFADQETAIRDYLGISDTSGGSRRSCFVAALVDARTFTGRDPETGKKLPGSNHGCWLGALGYMALLDQVGSCLRPRSMHVDGSEIKKSLAYFSNLSDPEIQALYALRCAFAHNYSLVNLNRTRQDLQHVFSLCQGHTAPLIKLPKVPWNGDLSTVTVDNRTVVNLEAFGDLVEAVCKRAREQAVKDDLEISLAGGVSELRHRYFFVVG
jgi:hypothetical protein